MDHSNSPTPKQTNQSVSFFAHLFIYFFLKKKKKERKEREKGCGEKRSQRELKRRKNKWIKKMNVFFPFPFL